MAWNVADTELEVHVLPAEDDVAHERSQDCACGPDVEFHERPLVIHHGLVVA